MATNTQAPNPFGSFIGVTVQIKLKQPPNASLQGKIVDIVAGERITLQNVFFPLSGARYGVYTVQSEGVADITVVQDGGPSPMPTPVPVPVPSVQLPGIQEQQPQLRSYPHAHPGLHIQTRAGAPARPPQPPSIQPPPQLSQAPARAPVGGPGAGGMPQRQPSNLQDPAILSFERSPAATRTTSRAEPETRTASRAQQETPTTPIKSALAKAAATLPNNSSPFIGEAGKGSSSHKVPKMKDLHIQTSSQTVKPKEVSAAQVQAADADAQNELGSKKKVRRGQKKKTGQDPPAVMNSEVSRNGNDMNGNVKRGKGWRQTPLLQQSPQTASPSGVNGKTSRKQRAKNEEAQRNGWATEDATDVQDDFDFEANLKLFDKKTVFDQMRQDDTTADEDRLVGHNKVQKNLKPNENVLSPPLGPKHSPNELDSSSDADTELNFANGRSSSRHSAARASMKRPSRQNSGQVAEKPHPLKASMSSERGISMSRSATSQGSKPIRKVPSIAAASPRPDRDRSPLSAVSAKTHTASTLASQITNPHFAIQPTMSTCPVLLPTGLEMLEKATIARYGLSPEAITESSARCIAETAMHMFDSASGSRRGSRANTLRGSMSSSMNLDRNSTPVIVILAGNHAVGARAVAAARHLVCRRTKIIVAEAQYESTETLDPQLKAQTSILKRLVKGGADVRRGPWRRASEYIKHLAGPPAVIIDALLAGQTFESLALSSANATFTDSAKTETRAMIDWANRSRAPVLAVACPSGVSGDDGQATYVEGEPLSIRPERVLALGVPMQGLLAAMIAGERWDVRLGDVGVNIALSEEDRVGFGSGWVVRVRFLDEEGVEAEGA